jgi:hypothetical protein
MMEEESGFDDSSSGGLKLSSLWVPAKVIVPARDTRKSTLVYSMLGGQSKLSLLSLIATIINDIYQHIRDNKAAK